uniref:Putative retroelement protein n=1 Tax=Sorghum bicolor TaxID=4558 RepID=B3VTB4_SORBI|nr:putative retroelement protein [Sorghum bicolor]
MVKIEVVINSSVPFQSAGAGAPVNGHELSRLPKSAQLAPQPTVTHFSGWWKKTTSDVPKEARKGLNSLIILVAWEIWKHRNTCVFDNMRPNVQEVLRAISSEGGIWCSAGASKLQELVLRLPSEA